MKTQFIRPYIFSLLAAVFVFAGTVWAQSTKLEERGVRSKSFTVSKGGNLEVSVSVGDIRISPWEKNEVYVSADGIDEEDLDRLKMSQSGNTVRVTFRPRWGESESNVRFEFSIPTQFNIDVSTSGGDIECTGGIDGKIKGSTAGGNITLESIKGSADMNTSGGDVRVGDIFGDGYLHTSGGNIRIGKVNGELEVGTSGGDIEVKSVGKSLIAKTSGGDIRIGDVGGEARVSTSGGNIEVGKVSGKATMNTAGGDIELKGASGSVKATTAGGDLRLQNVTGTIEAKTAGGEVEAELIPGGAGRSRLASAGGNVKISIPENAKVTIEATIHLEGSWGRKRERYSVKSDFKADSYERDDEEGEIRATYKLNGGGAIIELETSSADIEIRKMRAR